MMLIGPQFYIASYSIYLELIPIAMDGGTWSPWAHAQLATWLETEEGWGCPESHTSLLGSPISKIFNVNIYETKKSDNSGFIDHGNCCTVL